MYARAFSFLLFLLNARAVARTGTAPREAARATTADADAGPGLGDSSSDGDRFAAGDAGSTTRAGDHRTRRFAAGDRAGDMYVPTPPPPGDFFSADRGREGDGDGSGPASSSTICIFRGVDRGVPSRLRLVPPLLVRALTLSRICFFRIAVSTAASACASARSAARATLTASATSLG